MPLDPPMGLVRVQVPDALEDAFVDWMCVALARHPDLQIDLSVRDRGHDADCDVLVSRNAPDLPGVRRLRHERPVLAAHPGVLSHVQGPSNPLELVMIRCIRSSPTWTLAHDDGRCVQVPLGPGTTTRDARARRRALRLGAGVGMAREAELARFGLARVLPGWWGPARELYLALSPTREQLAGVRLVTQALARS